MKRDITGLLGLCGMLSRLGEQKDYVGTLTGQMAAARIVQDIAVEATKLTWGLSDLTYIELGLSLSGEILKTKGKI